MKKTTLMLDDYCASEGIKPTFVKIDVEGAERQVIQGMRVILNNLRPVVFVEVHTLATLTLAENAESIRADVTAAGYKMCHLARKQIIEDCTFLEGKHGRTFFLLLPGERDIPDWLPAFDTSKIP